MALSTSNTSKKILGIFRLAMINVIAVDSLRSLPASAEYGFSLVFFYIVAGLFFFIPTALVTAELATAWPNTGGVYIWARTAFGRHWGLLAIWLQWIYNVIWYPTILSFIAATLAYLFDPALANNKTYVIAVVVIVWWLATWLNCLGLKISSTLSILGAIIGTLIPMLVITGLGVAWFLLGHHSEINFSAATFLPNLSSMDSLAFLTTIVFGLMGLEMSAVHAGDVKNPARDYPRALLWSVLLIMLTLICASLAIAIIIPAKQLSILSGLTDAYAAFFKAYHLEMCVPVIVALIVLGSFSGVSAWVIGPTRGLMIALQENQIGSRWQRLNKHGMPSALLILQGVIVTVLAGLFILIPSVNGAYWILSAMTSQLALLFYLFLFTSAICLRYKESGVRRVFRIPGGNWGMWIVGSLGILSSLATFAFGFLPPPGVQIGSLLRFELILIGGTLIFCLLPLLDVWLRHSKKWAKNNHY